MTDLPKSTDVFSFITEASKKQARLRLAVSGPSGSGKTYSCINVLQEMGCEKLLVCDTENGSAAKYSNCFRHKFDVLDNKFWLSNFDPRRLIAVLKQVGSRYDGIVVDSLTHFWMGPGGFLTIVDTIAKKAQARGAKYDSFGAWKEADPIYAELIQTILGLQAHFACGLRAKADYEDVEVNGKKKKVKVGNAAQMREGFEFEFDIEGMMDMDHNFVVGKTRCPSIDGMIFPKPGANIAEPLRAWLTDGEPMSVAVLAAGPTNPPVVASTPEEVKAVVAPPAVVEETPPETVPETKRVPPSGPQPVATPAVETPAVSPLDGFLAKIGAAKTTEDLKSIADEIKTSLKAKEITQVQYNGTLSPAYAKKNKELKAGAAA